MDGNSSWRRYLVAGILSLLKAAATRRNRNRFTEELRDAGLFLGLAMLVRWAEDDGGGRSQGSSWANSVARRLRSADGEELTDRIERLFERQDVQRALREDVAPRIRSWSGDGERQLGERIRSQQ